MKIFIPSRNIWTPPRKQRGIICATAIYNPVAGPTVIVAATKNISATEPGGVATAGVRVDSDGDLYQSLNGTFYTSYETWLDSGTNNQVWVQCDIVSGSLTRSAGTGTRLACTSDREWEIDSPVDGLKTTVVDLDFWNAASGGSLLDTQRVTLNADATPD